MKKILFCSSLLIFYALAVRQANAQCATNGCTICDGTQLVCEGLNSVPPFEDGWSDIERISLTNGAIIEIPDGYFNLSSLESINLNTNQLTTFNMESLEYATSLRTIDLTGNPIVCDGNIDWLQKWKTFYPPGNRVTGTCTGSGDDINTYISDKPANLVAIKFAEASVALDRTCSEVTLPFVVIGNFASDLEYRAFIAMSPSSVEISVVNEYITVPVGANSSEVTIAVTNRGENRDNAAAFVQVYTKYPVSYETQVVVNLDNGLNAGCEAPVPVVVPTTPTPEETQGATTKPSVKPTQDDTKTMPPKVSTEPTSEPESTSEPKPTPAPRGFPVWLIILIIIIIVVLVFVGLYLFKRYKTPNKTVDDKPVTYEPVSGGDGKVYSETTKDIV